MPAPFLHAAPYCFGSAVSVVEKPSFVVTNLECGAAAALGRLVPLLGCGEEAAAFAFDGLAGRDGDERTQAALFRIADEECVHARLLYGLAAALPQTDEIALRRAARRFHIDLGRGSGVKHLARIAAIDAGVCTILGRLLRRGGPIAADPDVTALLTRIRYDEARHVGLSRRIVIERASGHGLDDIASAARQALADVLALVADAFESLAVDPARLFADLRVLPNGLLRG